MKQYLSSRLVDHGFCDWSGSSSSSNGHSEGSQNGEEVLSSESLEQIQSALKSLTRELLTIQGSCIKELTSTMNGSLPPTSFLDYSSFEKVTKTLFARDIRWSHILTLLVFASELANERATTDGNGVTNGKEAEAVDGAVPDVVDGPVAVADHKSSAIEFITHISEWLIRYLSSPEITKWIGEHDGWTGIVLYEKEKTTSNGNKDLSNQANGKDNDGSDDDNALNGLRSAINLVTAKTDV